ncbi:unnamed protein product [Ambrosiozyma monospora]|uniref:Unnamed protein product n=1 Tax=Ambrosiozyma monospora TaxID=43982 RepID=A0A9W6Z4Q8_AMBMO|nr:unnamed protein product [Ambrosiozyma monospora]
MSSTESNNPFMCPPSSPLMGTSEELTNFKAHFKPYRPLIQNTYEYPTPNPSSSIGDIPSDDLKAASPEHEIEEEEEQQHYEISEPSSPTRNRKQHQHQHQQHLSSRIGSPVDISKRVLLPISRTSSANSTDDKKKVNFNLDLNKTSIISSNSVTTSPPKINKKRRVQIVSPLKAVTPIRIPLDSSIISIGRSSSKNQYTLKQSNRGISRQHCLISYLKDEDMVSLTCLGYNGINVTIQSAIDVHKVEGKANHYIILPRVDQNNLNQDTSMGNNESNEGGVDADDEDNADDTEDEVFGEPSADSDRRILTRHHTFTNFCVFKNETFKMPLIEDTILDFRGELVRLCFKEDPAVQQKKSASPVIEKESCFTPVATPKDMSPVKSIESNCSDNLSNNAKQILSSSPASKNASFTVPPSSPIASHYDDYDYYNPFNSQSIRNFFRYHYCR